MTQPIIHDPKVAARAEHLRLLPPAGFYAGFAGLVQAALTDEGLTNTERVADIRVSLAALDLVLAERVGRLAPARCSKECKERPEEWPCLDSCPAQIAARRATAGGR